MTIARDGQAASADAARRLLPFLSRFAADVQAGRCEPLSAYLREFPGLEAAVAREYLEATDALGGASREHDLYAAVVHGQGPVDLGGYRLERRLGSGSQGTVYAAHRIADGEPVAIKVLHDFGDGAVDALRLREARLVGRLTNAPGVCRIHEVVTIAGGHSFVVMDQRRSGLKCYVRPSASRSFGDVTSPLVTRHTHRCLNTCGSRSVTGCRFPSSVR